MNISKPRLKRLAIHLLYRCAGDPMLPEQRLIIQVINLAIREIGDKYRDSTRYFYTRLFRLHCEGIGIDCDWFRGRLIECGLLPPLEMQAAA